MPPWTWEKQAILFVVSLHLFIVFGLTVLINPAEGIRMHKEKVYQGKWCKQAGGRIEVLLRDKTRVDCLTSQYAIEFDFGSKWAEAVGQALYYAARTGKEPGIVLILEKERDRKFWERLNAVVAHYDLAIKIWIMKPEDL
ncbi:MAG: hypothetical protein ACE5GQ_03140 [Nitrospinales bacterium]